MQWTPNARPQEQRRPYRDVLDALQERVRPFIERQPEFARPAYGSVLQSGADMLPGVGDVVGVEDLQAAARDGDPVGIGLGLLAAIPGIPAIGRGSRGARRGLMTGAREAAPSGGLMTDAESALARYRAVNPDDTGARVLNPGDEGYPTNAQWDEASQAYVAPVEPDYPIRAYHGSPHSFDQFSLDKIGTGEGAQAYGHGLYFAESEDVARAYRDTLSANTIRGTDGQTFRNRFIGDSEDFVGAVDEMAAGAGVPDVSPWMRRQVYGGYGSIIEDAFTKVDGNWDALPDTLRQTADDHAAGMRATGEPEDRIREIFDTYNNAAKVVEHANQTGVGRNPGSMYEVGINAHPDTFLDWDRPLSEQPEAVRNAVSGIPDLNGDSGGYIWDSLVKHQNARGAFGEHLADLNPAITTGPTAAQRALREAGVPGIRYLDAASRGVGEGSRNYVVFNDELVKILRKYGISGLGLTGGAALGGGLLGSPQDQQAQPTTF